MFIWTIADAIHLALFVIAVFVLGGMFAVAGVERLWRKVFARRPRLHTTVGYGITTQEELDKGVEHGKEDGARTPSAPRSATPTA